MDSLAPAQYSGFSHRCLYSCSCQTRELLCRVSESSPHLFPPGALWVPVVSGSLFDSNRTALIPSLLPLPLLPLRAGPSVCVDGVCTPSDLAFYLEMRKVPPSPVLNPALVRFPVFLVKTCVNWKNRLQRFDSRCSESERKHRVTNFGERTAAL